MDQPAATIAARLIGQTDLYTALRHASAGLTEGQADMLLPAILSALGAAPEAARLASVDQGLLRVVLRAGAGLPPTKGLAAVQAHLETATPAPLFLPEIAQSPRMALLTGGQMPDMPAYSDRAFGDWFDRQTVAYGLGPYGEKRSVYQLPRIGCRCG